MNNYNITSGKVYEGQNQVDLTITAKKAGYKSNEWGTFLQWRDNNRMIIKGEHGISIFKGYERFNDMDKNGEFKRTVSRPLGFARVFNRDQTIGTEKSGNK